MLSFVRFSYPFLGTAEREISYPLYFEIPTQNLTYLTTKSPVSDQAIFYLSKSEISPPSFSPSYLTPVLCLRCKGLALNPKKVLSAL